MAHWPARGNDLTSIDYSRMRVGTVHYYCKHKVKFAGSHDIDALPSSEHIMNGLLAGNKGILMKDGMEYQQLLQ